MGLIVRDAKVVKKLIDTFESDWTTTSAEEGAGVAERDGQLPRLQPAVRPTTVAVSDKDAQKAVQVFTKELDPLAATVKKAVRKAVAKAGDDVLHDKDVKDTMKKVVKKAVKEAVKEAVKAAVSDAEAARTGA